MKKKDKKIEEFFNEFLKNEIDKDVNLKKDIVKVFVPETKEEDVICFLIDKNAKIIVIDDFFQSLKTFLDTTNKERIARKIIDKTDIDDEFEDYKFIFISKNNPAFFDLNSIAIRKFIKSGTYRDMFQLGLYLNVRQLNFTFRYEYEFEKK
ncbi:hypothetical protein Abu_1344 [Aliarcobacter butzleri RM4018]|uniref:Uncharacterized protein n=1 Tax=Aliarcobacter butzleri (strain RM4018) TaxID=367737 RepID=A8EUH6_ALIB4|nr:hypothetical protein [Aliarcobacter butzleri]ABV67600.1 hypothetical protein Abu_1344 [Aliarcobacter butzleri RM4018]GGT74795.1 hypothetical protein GCM10007985_08420 [Aliarcobacter butzleri]SNV29496.1 Uncharacterised protein [Aliarcobacter butzleri]